jgi:hypothetical protein
MHRHPTCQRLGNCQDASEGIAIGGSGATFSPPPKPTCRWELEGGGKGSGRTRTVLLRRTAIYHKSLLIYLKGAIGFDGGCLERYSGEPPLPRLLPSYGSPEVDAVGWQDV